MAVTVGFFAFSHFLNAELISSVTLTQDYSPFIYTKLHGTINMLIRLMPVLRVNIFGLSFNAAAI
jgi:hypothetical protein